MRRYLLLVALVAAPFESRAVQAQSATAAPVSAELPCRMKNPDDPRPRVGLVLGGGGARGAAHISIIKKLESLHVPIDCIAGTSMGALIGGLYASGMTSTELEDMVKTLDWTALLNDTV